LRVTVLSLDAVRPLSSKKARTKHPKKSPHDPRRADRRVKPCQIFVRGVNIPDYQRYPVETPKLARSPPKELLIRVTDARP